MRKVLYFSLLLTFAWARGVNRRQFIRPGEHCDVICDEENPSAFKAICGSDGVLYSTKCDYNNAMCKARQNGTVLLYTSIGPECVTIATTCDVIQQTSCMGTHSLPPIPGGPIMIGSTKGGSFVCGTDGHTYGSVCELMKQRCADPAAQLEVDHDGNCGPELGNNSRQVNCSQYVVDLGGLALEGGAHVSLKVRPCEKIYKPVCGIDGRTYSNECTFCGFLTYRHIIQTGHLTAPIMHDGSCSHDMHIG